MPFVYLLLLGYSSSLIQVWEHHSRAFTEGSYLSWSANAGDRGTAETRNQRRYIVFHEPARYLETGGLPNNRDPLSLLRGDF